jgi:outer membrane protein assembly factor BamB/tRNA A-37 threonylcarbamoyl transferase component Bud32
MSSQFSTQQLPRRDRGGREGVLVPGTTLQGRYRILGVIGHGGMGSVYQARDLHFPNVTRLCAVKEMINTAPDPQLREMIIRNFEREANILAELDHPAIPEVFDYFSQDSRSYLVLEFIQGRDLEALLADATDFFSEDQVRDWAIQVCDVLEYLHAHQPQPIVFRDMKPSNVMLDQHGRIRLVDFGIAKLFEGNQKGTMIGTEGYSPPEQYRGQASPQGDVYALGAALHHLLTRQDPRLEPPFSFAERPIRKANAAVSPQLEAVIQRALSYEPSERWESAAALKAALLATIQRTAAAPAGAGGMTARAVYTGVEHVEPIWSFACEDEVRSTPAGGGGVIYIGCYDHNLYALDARSGEFLWKFATEGGIAASPAVWQELVLIGSEDQAFYAVSARSGRLAWSCRTDGRVRSSARVAYGHAFVGSDDSFLYAINLGNGRVAWKTQGNAPVRSTPAIADDFIYFGDEEGFLQAVTIRGELKWRFRAKRAFTSSPVVVEDMLVAGSQDGQVYALSLHSGFAVWRFRTGRPVVSTAAYASGAVYIGSADGFLYALEAGTGRQIWKYEVGAQIVSSPAIFERALYFGAVDGFVYSVEAQKGALRWKYQTGGPVASSPAIIDGQVVIGSNDRHVYALPL